jgi:hypothetical protein
MIMTTTVKKVPIHAVVGLRRMADGIAAPMLDSSLKGLLANAGIYTKPPVDLTTYGNNITAYKDSIPAAIDGSKTAVAQRNKLKEAAIKNYTELAHYVEANCNDDMVTFLLSGFQPKPTARTSTAPASDSIRKIEHGPNAGQLVVTLMAVKGAKSYVLRYGASPLSATPGTWTDLTITSVRPATTISGLTPGTVYAFRVQALLKPGYTDWSDPLTMMCT